MDHTFERYYDQVIGAVRTAEVISIFFVEVGKSLILDWRRDEDHSAVVLIDEMAESPEARLATFERLRPGLPLPERLTLAPWVGGVRQFAETGILDAIVERCRLEGGDVLAGQALEHYGRLLRVERRTVRELVRGVGMRTIWQRDARG